MSAFEGRKALQAVAYLLGRQPDKKMTIMRLMKLLYFAERRSLRETGDTITGDRMVALEHGPILSCTKDCIDHDLGQGREWLDFVKRKGRQVILTNDPGTEELCEYELQVLDEIDDKFRGFTTARLRNLSHTFPELRKNRPARGSSKDILMKDILDAVGRGDDLGEVEAHARERRFLARAFGAE